MKKLTEADIINVMKEEWNAKVKTVFEGLKVAATVNGDTQPIIAPELKVKHKKSGMLYTVDSISMRDVVLRTPEGELMQLDSPEFEQDYEVA